MTNQSKVKVVGASLSDTFSLILTFSSLYVQANAVWIHGGIFLSGMLFTSKVTSGIIRSCPKLSQGSWQKFMHLPFNAKCMIRHEKRRV